MFNEPIRGGSLGNISWYGRKTQYYLLARRIYTYFVNAVYITLPSKYILPLLAGYHIYNQNGHKDLDLINTAQVDVL